MYQNGKYIKLFLTENIIFLVFSIAIVLFVIRPIRYMTKSNFQFYKTVSFFNPF